MRSFDQPFSSPLLVMAAQAPPQPSFNMDHTFSSPYANAKTRSPLTSWSNSTYSSIPPSAAGRKRSRDEAALNLEEDHFEVKLLAAQSEPESEDDRVYGEGMTLARPSKAGAYIIEASSQFGTWIEDKAEVEKANAMAPIIVERPILRANKSQRLDLSATPIIAEESIVNAYLSPGSPERFKEPTVDDFTRHLGIGWSSVNYLDLDIQAAARGWEKFIENHYPVTNVHIRLQSKGLASYLVEASEGYYLFRDDLKQGRLVSTSLDRTWVNLSTPVPVFEGALTMEAGQTPKCGATPIDDSNFMIGVQTEITSPNGTIDFASDGTHAINITGATNVNSKPILEVEMDMS